MYIGDRSQKRRKRKIINRSVDFESRSFFLRNPTPIFLVRYSLSFLPLLYSRDQEWPDAHRLCSSLDDGWQDKFTRRKRRAHVSLYRGGENSKIPRADPLKGADAPGALLPVTAWIFLARISSAVHFARRNASETWARQPEDLSEDQFRKT